ncbi:hypothetical protein EDB19DRAFT_1762309 [Suillus lakei]|nr:hypothetical protein EDB19DRAFT_1762309 [Suillus lakei]
MLRLDLIVVIASTAVPTGATTCSEPRRSIFFLCLGLNDALTFIHEIQNKTSSCRDRSIEGAEFLRASQGRLKFMNLM